LLGPPDALMTTPPPRAVLLIGVHREELAFGEAVAGGLDPDLIQVLRIPQGISGVRPNQDGAFCYATNHQELYLQILPLVRGRYDLVIDLHCGINEPTRCADVYSADLTLLDCVGAGVIRDPQAFPGPVRPVWLRGTARGDQPPALHQARTVIPDAFWHNPGFRYLGLECFLMAAGAGVPADWMFARGLIAAALACAQGQAADGVALGRNR
jgi:hypothetical protein